MDFNKICIGCMHERTTESGPCPVCGLDPAVYTQDSAALPPQTILNGKYLVGKMLGKGGFGITYLAMNLSLEKVVAIKEYFVSAGMVRDYGNTLSVLIPTEGNGDSNVYKVGRQKFIAEARTLAKLDHLRGIVQVFDYFEENNTAYIVMEYMNGMTMKDWISKEKGKLTFAEAVKLLDPVIESLGYVHEQGVIHRDISPDNLMFTGKDELKLLDFGGMKQLDTSGDGMRSSVVFMKKGYSPIEQYATDDKQGPWTDVYAMTATLVYCITGHHPENSMDRAASLEQDDLRIPKGLVTPEQLNVLQKGMSLYPAQRYQSMQELRGALAACLSKKSGDAGSEKRPHTVTKPEAVSPVKPPKPTQIPPEKTIAPSKKKRKWPGILLCLVIFGAAYVIGKNVFQSDTETVKDSQPMTTQVIPSAAEVAGYTEYIARKEANVRSGSASDTELLIKLSKGRMVLGTGTMSSDHKWMEVYCSEDSTADRSKLEAEIVAGDAILGWTSANLYD